MLALRDDDVVVLRTVVHDMTADDDGTADDNPRPRQRRRMEGGLTVQGARALRVSELKAALTTRGCAALSSGGRSFVPFFVFTIPFELRVPLSYQDYRMHCSVLVRPQTLDGGAQGGVAAEALAVHGR